MKELILNAIKDFNLLLSLLENKEKSKIGESFRARCRDFPSFIEDVGFLSALSFCYAKATKNIYEEVKKAFEDKSTIKDGDSTKQGYGIYLYLLLRRLKELGLIKTVDPLKALEEIMNGKERIVEKLIEPYLIQLKKLSEAVFRI
ncbi:MAG: type III-B CRISPR module-associated protein Cmr5 [Candidatus Bathyarchaeia archaeon]